MKYDVIVVGGGHAGCEAANASAKMGLKTALVTANIKNIADMPCNPSIGGTAKGIVVREIDALGGLMGKIADKTHIQIKMLNNAKGPAVRSLRAQGDKITYPREMLKALNSLENLTIIEGMVENLIVENNTIKGIILANKILNNKNCLMIADDVGLGKTYEGLGIIFSKFIEKSGQNILIIAPNEQIGLKWKKEYDYFKDN